MLKRAGTKGANYYPFDNSILILDNSRDSLNVERLSIHATHFDINAYRFAIDPRSLFGANATRDKQRIETSVRLRSRRHNRKAWKRSISLALSSVPSFATLVTFVATSKVFATVGGATVSVLSKGNAVSLSEDPEARGRVGIKWGVYGFASYVLHRIPSYGSTTKPTCITFFPVKLLLLYTQYIILSARDTRIHISYISRACICICICLRKRISVRLIRVRITSIRVTRSNPPECLVCKR